MRCTAPPYVAPLHPPVGATLILQHTNADLLSGAVYDAFNVKQT